jgi:transcriptional regulator GlxA family with amidase domain
MKRADYDFLPLSSKISNTVIKSQINKILSKGKQLIDHFFVENSPNSQMTDAENSSHVLNSTTSQLPEKLLENASWLKKVDQVLSQKITTSNFDVEELAAEMHITRQYLNTRIKHLTGQTAVQYVQMARLKTAQNLLITQTVSSVQEAAETVGFRDVKYFSQLYKKNFGVLPSTHLRE